MIEKEIGKRIQMYRKKAGITQDQLSEKIGLSKNHLSSIERGIYSIKIYVLVTIMNILNCSADEIFCDVIDKGVILKSSRLYDKISVLPYDEQNRILEVVDPMVKNARKS